MIGVALLASLSVAGAAPGHTCPPPPVPTPRIEQYMAQRAWFGFRHDRAYVKKLIRAGVWEYDVGYIPVTPAENRYLRLRDQLDLGPRAYRYLRRHPDLSGGLSVEDDWPHEPYLLLRVTGSPARLLPTLRGLVRYPRNLRLRHVAHSERALSRLQDRISDDFDALDAEGLRTAGVGVDTLRNDVEVEVITARTDAAALLRRRYGPDVRVKVIATTLTSPACADLGGYRLEPDPLALTVLYQTGGGATFDHAVVTETDTAVTVAIVVQQYNGPTTAESTTAAHTITLNAPLGTRAVISEASGKPLAVARP